MKIIDEIELKGIKKIFSAFGIDIEDDKNGFYYELYNCSTEETFRHYFDIYSDDEIASSLNISVETLYEEAQSCLAA